MHLNYNGPVRLSSGAFMEHKNQYKIRKIKRNRVGVAERRESGFQRGLHGDGEE